jgi:hypothetical protein
VPAAKKRFTSALIREHFGKEADIHRRLFGGFHVTTPTGADLDISDDKILFHAGSEDAYRAMVTLCHEAWGEIVPFGNSEHIIATMAHAEALGVNAIPEVKPSGGGCLRLFVVAAVFFLMLSAMRGANSTDNAWNMTIAAVVSALVSRGMKQSQRREARRRGQKYRYTYPRVQGSPREAQYDDAKRQGWL